MAQFRLGILCLLSLWNFAVAQEPRAANSAAVQHDPNLRNFQAIELRRYTVKEGERVHFAQYFESYFPEAFQQLGAIAAGSFFERDHSNGFTWIRGFHTLDDRAVANAAFYYGPLWAEHRDTLNHLIVDSDNVMLLRPLTPDRGIPILPAVDPVTEPGGAQGVVVAQIFALKPDSIEKFSQASESVFASYRNAGARDAGILVSLDVANNFPQLPVRTDGPYFIWMGILKDNQILETNFRPAVDRGLSVLSATGLMRGTPELVILDPSPRSRLRWLP